MNRTFGAIGFLCTFICLMFTGCQETQTNDAFTQMQERQMTLMSSVEEDARKLEVLSANLKTVEKNLELLNNQIANLGSRLNNVAALPEKLEADIDANRIYLKTVRDDLATIRNETAQIVRVQNECILQGRQVYTQLMEKEIDVLSLRLQEMKSTVTALTDQTPQLERKLDEAVSVIAGRDNDPNRSPAPSPKTAEKQTTNN